MKELIDLGWIFKSLGICCSIEEGDEENENSLHVVSNQVSFDIWYYSDLRKFEIHYNYGSELVYDTLCLGLLDTVLEVGTKVSKYGK